MVTPSEPFFADELSGVEELGTESASLAANATGGGLRGRSDEAGGSKGFGGERRLLAEDEAEDGGSKCQHM